MSRWICRICVNFCLGLGILWLPIFVCCSRMKDGGIWSCLQLCCNWWNEAVLLVCAINWKELVGSKQGMDFTTDKLRSLVRKWQSLIESHVDVKTTDNYMLRIFCIGFTKKRPNQIKRTCYAQSSQIRQVCVCWILELWIHTHVANLFTFSFIFDCPQLVRWESSFWCWTVFFPLVPDQAKDEGNYGSWSPELWPEGVSCKVHSRGDWKGDWEGNIWYLSPPEHLYPQS